jgi:hypothetical protein
MKVVAVEREARSVADLRKAIDIAGLQGMVRVIHDDYANIELRGKAALTVATGVLQHCQTHEELSKRLDLIRDCAVMEPLATIYLEVLLHMKFDGKPPTDGRLEISQDAFERQLRHQFTADKWFIERVNGPLRKIQKFNGAPRSFYSAHSAVELTAVEYVIVRSS